MMMMIVVKIMILVKVNVAVDSNDDADGSWEVNILMTLVTVKMAAYFNDPIVQIV
uniref:Uncharacterized protein n=1 Tax=Arion vulgaris TaxID=1028688 RepID=A0A0B7BE12_9EUPU